MKMKIFQFILKIKIQHHHSLLFDKLTTAGEGMWMIDTERGRIWLASWQRAVPSDKPSPRSSGRVVFSRASRVWGGETHKSVQREYTDTAAVWGFQFWKGLRTWKERNQPPTHHQVRVLNDLYYITFDKCEWKVKSTCLVVISVLMTQRVEVNVCPQSV